MQVLDNLMEKVRPDALRLGRIAEAYAERVLSRLDAIHAAVQEEEWQEVHSHHHFTLTADDEENVAQIAPGTSWELETLAVLDACTITVNESGAFHFARQFNNADTIPQVGIMFRGGNDITIVSTGNATPVRVFLQFKVRTPRPARKTTHAGHIDTHPRHPRSPLEEGRHGDPGARIPVRIHA